MQRSTYYKTLKNVSVKNKFSKNVILLNSIEFL